MHSGLVAFSDNEEVRGALEEILKRVPTPEEEFHIASLLEGIRGAVKDMQPKDAAGMFSTSDFIDVVKATAMGAVTSTGLSILWK